MWTCKDLPAARLTPERQQFAVAVTGGPTTVLDVAGRRFICDPTFDPPGDYGYLQKLAGPAVDATAVGDVDAVLLSHDLHPDNFDNSGREMALRSPLILAPRTAANRLGRPAQALAPWSSWTADGVTITAVPAQHGPEDGDLNEEGFVNCEVSGFIIESADSPKTYVSGDNASLRLVREIYDQIGPVDVAVFFAGSASLPTKFQGRPLSLTAERTVAATEILGAKHVVVAHQQGWGHFTQNDNDTRRAFAQAGLTQHLCAAAVGDTCRFIN